MMRAVAVKDVQRATRTNESVRCVAAPSIIDSVRQLERKTCACGGSCPRCQESLPVYKKLSISKPDDHHEVEADRVAESVMRMRDREIVGITSLAAAGKSTSLSERFTFLHHDPFIQHRASEGMEDIVRRRMHDNRWAGGKRTPSVHESAHSSESPGRPMPETTRTEMESCFGEDFSSVNIHTDERATQMSQELNAQAYTIGNDIFFNSGAYNPGSTAGGHLLAHELSHVVQYKRGDVSPNTIQRALADVKIPEPILPVDCKKEITQDYNCFDLIADMIAIGFDLRENDRWIKECESGEKPGDTDVCKIRKRVKAELQKKFDEKERIRAACCPDHEVPPEAPTHVPTPTPQPTEPEASSEKK